MVERDPRPLEGVTRCACGCKYWDGTTCHSCGERWKPRRCEFRTDCDRPAKFYAGGPGAGDWACPVCEGHLPKSWRIMDRYFA